MASQGIKVSQWDSSIYVCANLLIWLQLFWNLVFSKSKFLRELESFTSASCAFQPIAFLVMVSKFLLRTCRSQPHFLLRISEHRGVLFVRDHNSCYRRWRVRRGIQIKEDTSEMVKRIHNLCHPFVNLTYVWCLLFVSERGMEAPVNTTELDRSVNNLSTVNQSYQRKHNLDDIFQRSENRKIILGSQPETQ